MELVKQGKYKAKPVNWGIEPREGKLPVVKVVFRFEENGAFKNLTWNGYLNEGKAREIAIKALIACGFKDNDLTKFSEGAQGGALDLDKEVQITVEQDTNTNTGKVYNVVKWINPIGGQKFQKLASKGEVQSSLAGLNLKADILAAKQKLGVTEAPVTETIDDLPF